VKHIAEVPKTQIALRLQQEMDQRGLTLQDVAKMFDLSYEYARRLVRGHNSVSKNVLWRMSKIFDWDVEEMDKLLVGDRWRQKNGPLGAIAQEFDTEVEPFEKGFKMLDQTQKQFLLANLNLFIAQNRRSTRGGKSKDEFPLAGPLPMGLVSADAMQTGIEDVQDILAGSSKKAGK
jgi:transcriptional regulator with XRE-family HTH domain